VKLEKRIEKIEDKLNIKHGCFLLVTIWDGSEGPTKEQSAQFLKHKKETGLCENCDGICVFDWTAQFPRITQQRSVEGRHTLPAEVSKQHNWSFVIGKGYRETGN